MLKIVMAAFLTTASLGSALAGQPGTMPSIELAQVAQPEFDGSAGTIESGRPGWRPGWRPGVRQEHYYCVINGDKFCSVREQRVGGVCRCPGQTGSGRVVVQ